MYSEGRRRNALFPLQQVGDAQAIAEASSENLTEEFTREYRSDLTVCVRVFQTDF